MAISESGIQVSTGAAEWQLEIPGQNSPQAVATSYATNHPRPNLLLVTGWGEDNLEETAGLFGKMGIHLAVCNLAYSNAGAGIPLTPEVVEATIVQGTSAVIQKVNDQAGRSPDTPMYGVGRSKGAADLGVFADAQPERLRRIGLLAPTGYNFAAMGDTRSQQRSELCNRLGAAGLVKLFEKPATVEDNKGLSVGEETRRLFAELIAGLKFARTKNPGRITKRLHELGLLKELVVISNDVICPEQEYEPELKEGGLKNFTRRIPGRHAPLPERMAVLQTAHVIRSVVPWRELWLT